MVYAGQMAAADVPTMTNSSWRMLRLTCEYADLMRGLRAEAGKVFSGLCEMFEMYLLHVFHNFSDVSLAELVSPHQQQQQVGIINVQDLTFVNAVMSDELISPHQQQQRVDPRASALWAQQAGSQWRGAVVMLAAAGTHSCTRHHSTRCCCCGAQAGWCAAQSASPAPRVTCSSRWHFGG